MEEWDECVWPTIDPDDLWVYDKLILSKKLGHICGPGGIPVPSPNHYVVRPITNIYGMGLNTRLQYFEEDTDRIPPGYFWCEKFEGRHLSIDYLNGKQVLCVEGFKPSHTFTQWEKWERTDDTIPLPPILQPFIKKYPKINCEFIGGRLIEVHFRHNPDFTEDVDVLYPVWDCLSPTPPEGMRFISSPDYRRLGFFTPIK